MSTKKKNVVEGIETQFAVGDVLKIWHDGFNGYEVFEVRVKEIWKTNEERDGNGKPGKEFLYHVLQRVSSGLDFAKATEAELAAQVIRS